MKGKRKENIPRFSSCVWGPLSFEFLSYSVTAVEKSKDVKRKTQDYTPDAHSSAAGCLFDISLWVREFSFSFFSFLLFSSHASLLSSWSQRSFPFFRMCVSLVLSSSYFALSSAFAWIPFTVVFVIYSIRSNACISWPFFFFSQYDHFLSDASSLDTISVFLSVYYLMQTRTDFTRALLWASSRKSNNKKDSNIYKTFYATLDMELPLVMLKLEPNFLSPDVFDFWDFSDVTKSAGNSMKSRTCPVIRTGQSLSRIKR